MTRAYCWTALRAWPRTRKTVERVRGPDLTIVAGAFRSEIVDLMGFVVACVVDVDRDTVGCSEVGSSPGDGDTIGDVFGSMITLFFGGLMRSDLGSKAYLEDRRVDHWEKLNAC